MKETSGMSHHTRIGPIRFVAVGLAVLFVLSMFSSTWARSNQNRLQQSLPEPTPQPGVVDFDVFGYSLSANTGDTLWFTARVSNGTGGTIPTIPQPKAEPMSSGVTVTLTLSNLEMQVPISVTQGTVITSLNRIDWIVGPVAPDSAAYLHVKTTVLDGKLPVRCDGTLAYNGEELSDSAAANYRQILLCVCKNAH